MVDSANLPPAWARRAIWYQIVPERFCNGDPSNDPTMESQAGAHYGDPSPHWQVHRWTSDWYELAPYERAQGGDFWYHVFRRRYGGDLQGILDRLGYLEELGVNALYLTPVFQAPSLHKYDASTYHHVDPHFGPDPAGDLALIAREVPHDPATWHWTAADRLMLSLIAEVHRRGMRIIFDGVFNHMGRTSWALRDVAARQRGSAYRDWFRIASWDDAAAGTSFAYQGWAGHSSLPELAQDEHGPVAGPRDYIFAATRRWMAPHGRAAEGIDGWRLDVAGKVAAPFWRQWRALVRSINPDAYLTAEIIDELDRLPEMLQGDQFDAAMGYPFAFACHDFFFAGARACQAAELMDRLEAQRAALPAHVPPVMQNLFGSHDTARLASHAVNGEHLTYHRFDEYAQRQAKAQGPSWQARAPDARERELQLLFVLFQVTYVGAPMIYYGDEAGLWGANDPCCRKPMLWPELGYDDEVALADGTRRASPDPVGFDAALFHGYRERLALRRRLAALAEGEVRTLATTGRVLAFARTTATQTVIVALCAEDQGRELRLAVPAVATRWYDALADDRTITAQGELVIALAPRSGMVLWTELDLRDSLG